ncbi:MAG: trimethylamine methyltransferase family protein [Spirochaetota bacterium]|nr:MAG: trimethylamine methyltransferase family protein [Spirochaetota bacterium]
MKKPFEPSVKVQVLNKESIQKIHNATLEVLDKTGVAINTEEGRKLLLDAGCKIKDNNVITIPSKIIEKAIKSAPSSVTLFDRLGQERCILEGWKTSFGTGSDCPFILDRETGEKRQCTYNDVAHGALVCDALEHLDFIMPVGIISDRPKGVADVYAVDATLKNTIIPVVFTAHNKDTFQSSIDLAVAVTGSLEKLQEKPFICLYDEPTSPLKHMPEATDKLIHAARLRLPVIFTPCPLAGATAPATGAGMLVQANAECLSGLVIQQIINPGAPFIYGGVMNILDMSTTVAPYGSPELHKLCAALTDMAHHYGLPMFGTCGCSDAKTVDAQAGTEVGVSVLMSTLNGQNLIHDIGFLESALITSYEMYILSNEAIGMAKHIASGVSVDKDTLAVDVIDDVGQAGNYLEHEHTLKHFRREFYFPGIFDRANYDGWERAGRKTMDIKLKERADEIIATHQPEKIDKTALKYMDQVLQRLKD